MAVLRSDDQRRAGGAVGAREEGTQIDAARRSVAADLVGVTVGDQHDLARVRDDAVVARDHLHGPVENDVEAEQVAGPEGDAPRCAAEGAGGESTRDPGGGQDVSKRIKRIRVDSMSRSATYRGGTGMEPLTRCP